MKRPGASFDPDDVDPKQVLLLLPSQWQQALEEGRKLFDAEVEKGVVNDDNYPEFLESTTDQIVDKFNLAVGGEDNAIRVWNTVYSNLMTYAQVRYPGI